MMHNETIQRFYCNNPDRISCSNGYDIVYIYIIPLDMKGCICHFVAYTPFHIQRDELCWMTVHTYIYKGGLTIKFTDTHRKRADIISFQDTTVHR